MLFTYSLACNIGQEQTTKSGDHSCSWLARFVSPWRPILVARRRR
uniref:ERF70 n=1 Tax=Arundo donax TaxID=35708 RepID=A0A0A9AWX2_ARUDO